MVTVDSSAFLGSTTLSHGTSSTKTVTLAAKDGTKTVQETRSVVAVTAVEPVLGLGTKAVRPTETVTVASAGSTVARGCHQSTRRDASSAGATAGRKGTRSFRRF